MSYITENDIESKYDDSLDEMDKESLFDNYDNSNILKKIDETAYNVGLWEFRDSSGIVQCPRCSALFDDKDDLKNGLCEDCREMELEEFEHEQIEKII